MKGTGITLVCVLVSAVLWAGPSYADIYVRRGPDGTMHFSNCPMGTEWKLYAREKTRQYPSFQNQYRRSYSKSRTQYESLINAIATGHGMNPSVIRSIIEVESGFDPQAKSSKGAMGLMQLMPETAQELGVSDPWDPTENITGGTKYISWLLRKYNGDLSKALAAYNAGPNAVDSYGGIPPYQETSDYVKSVMARIYGGGNERE
jgi:soluble lytic murein transglycosylase-like protein